ncbi:mucin-5AC [Wyeomyia smithii]|uniref:mucin-5AC n=1 Tax=Wyeomyia smithii TaxID=174621 RepID=UPI0024681D2C|nr:mucin-5AC [Wyeomyia smithii]
MKKPSVFLLTNILFWLQLSLASSVPKDLPDGVVGTSLNNKVQSQDKTALQLKLNATVSNVIAAMDETSFPEEQPNQEHSRKGRIMPRKGVDINATLATTTTSTAMTPASNATEAKPPNVAAAPVGNTNISISNNNSINTALVSSNKTTITTPSPPAISDSSKPIVLPTTQSSTTSTITTTTTTKAPKKPKITYSVDDEPKLLQAAKPGYNSASSLVNTGLSTANGRLHVEEPLAELSREYIPPAAMLEPSGGHREYVVPVVTLIFAIPLLIGLFLLSYRRAKEFWLTRHYRRMDFLVDGMYNY